MDAVAMDAVTMVLIFFIVYVPASIQMIRWQPQKLTVVAQTQYHCFAHPCGDQWSNVAFMVVGLMHLALDPILGLLGLAVAAGSTYYHCHATKQRLFWDRLPMVVELAYLFNMAAPGSFWVLLFANVAVLVYWYQTDNLLMYAALQLAACLFFAVHVPGMRFAVGLYFLAKVAEDNDHGVWIMSQKTISGHTLKHLLAAAALGTIG